MAVLDAISQPHLIDPEQLPDMPAGRQLRVLGLRKPVLTNFLGAATTTSSWCNHSLRQTQEGSRGQRVHYTGSRPLQGLSAGPTTGTIEKHAGRWLDSTLGGRDRT